MASADVTQPEQARQSVRDLSGRGSIGRRGILAVKDDFVFVGGLLRGKSWESLDGFDARDSGGDEVVEVVGGENGTHGAGFFTAMPFAIVCSATIRVVMVD